MGEQDFSDKTHKAQSEWGEMNKSDYIKTVNFIRVESICWITGDQPVKKIIQKKNE